MARKGRSAPSSRASSSRSNQARRKSDHKAETGVAEEKISAPEASDSEAVLEVSPSEAPLAEEPPTEERSEQEGTKQEHQENVSTQDAPSEEAASELESKEAGVSAGEDFSQPEVESAAETGAFSEVPETPSNSEVAIAPKPSRRGFGGALMGGALAAGLGFGGAYVLGQPGMPLNGMFAQDQSAAIGAFEAALTEERLTRENEIAQLRESFGADGGQAFTQLREETQEALSTNIIALAERTDQMGAALEAEFMGMLEPIAASLNGLENRLLELEQRPLSGAVSQGAIEAYERELAELEASVISARSELEASAAESRAEIAALVELAAAERAAAANAAEMAAASDRLAAARVEIGRIRLAISEGSGGFEEELNRLSELSGIAAPEALALNAQNGPARIEELREAYPDLARRALANARASDADVEQSGFTARLGASLERAFQVRSVTPREGSGVDAILSRAEEALRSGNFSATLSEIEALPAEAREPFAEWLSLVRSRMDALDALDVLDAQLSSQEG